MTGRDIQVFVVALMVAQDLNDTKRIISFKTEWELLQLLGWGHSQHDYDDLRSALRKWSKVKVTIKKCHRTRYIHINGQIIKSDDPIIERVHFPVIFRHRYEGSRLSISFGKAFWYYHKDKKIGMWLRAHHDEVRALRYVPEILLYLHLNCFHQNRRMNLTKMALRSGIAFRNASYDKQRIEKALKAIEKLHKAKARHYHLHVTRKGVARISSGDELYGITGTVDFRKSYEELAGEYGD